MSIQLLIYAQTLSEEDRAFYNKYGRLPPSKQILASRLKVYLKT